MKQIYTKFERCTNCQGCEVACQRVNNGLSFIRVMLVEDRFAVPLTCRQCDPAPCAMACPPQALSFNGNGVKLNADKCTGCTLCLFACPFGVLEFDVNAKVAVNCDMCAARQALGRDPACILTCPSSALHYGDFASYAVKERRRASAEISRAQPLR
jgi:formate dehydrogenase iron-sulfur subunit